MAALPLLLAASVPTYPAGLPPLETALAACTSWISEPATWSESINEFGAKTGLDRSGLTRIPGVPEFALPPPQARTALHHWRITQAEQGYFVSASDRTPLCHIVGGGSADLYSVVDALTESDHFKSDWRRTESETRGDMQTMTFVHRELSSMTLTLSRAAKANARRDRPQILATVVWNLEN